MNMFINFSTYRKIDGMKKQILSASEASVLADKTFFTVKASLDKKIKALLEDVLAQLEQCSLPHISQLPIQMQRAQSRYFQGELHSNFPWRAVDHRAVYSRSEILAFRCLIRYGGPVSLHWTLAGSYQTHFAERIAQHAPVLASHGLQLCLHSSPWEWALGPETLLPIGEMQPIQLMEIFKERSFLKLSALFPADDFEWLPARAVAAWTTILDLLTSTRPD
jgi:hypothetical protein